MPAWGIIEFLTGDAADTLKTGYTDAAGADPLVRQLARTPTVQSAFWRQAALPLWRIQRQQDTIIFRYAIRKVVSCLPAEKTLVENGNTI